MSADCSCRSKRTRKESLWWRKWSFYCDKLRPCHKTPDFRMEFGFCVLEIQLGAEGVPTWIIHTNWADSWCNNEPCNSINYWRKWGYNQPILYFSRLVVKVHVMSANCNQNREDWGQPQDLNWCGEVPVLPVTYPVLISKALAQGPEWVTGPPPRGIYTLKGKTYRDSPMTPRSCQHVSIRKIATLWKWS